LKKIAWNACLGGLGLKGVDHFGSLMDFVETAMVFRNLAVIEIMVHPGQGGAFQGEEDRLCTAWWSRACERAIFQSYSSIRRRSSEV
jgi:hypothetical protein